MLVLYFQFLDFEESFQTDLNIDQNQVPLEIFLVHLQMENDKLQTEAGDFFPVIN